MSFRRRIVYTLFGFHFIIVIILARAQNRSNPKMFSRKESASSAKKENATPLEEAWKCEICLEEIKNSTIDMMECEFCGKHFCRECLNISKGDYKVLSKRSDTHWFALCVKRKQCQALIAKN